MLLCSACQAELPLGAESCPECAHEAEGAARALAEGIRFFSDLHYEAALKAFERARQIAPDCPEAQLCYAHGLYHVGRTEAALSEYQELKSQQPANLALLYNLGQILINQGRLDQARGVFESLTHASAKFSPDSFYLGLLFPGPAHFQADCFYYLAIVSWNRGETEAAEHYFERALDLNPSHAQACRHLGNFFFQDKAFDKAIELFRRYLALGAEEGATLDDVVEVTFNLGIAYFDLGDDDQATEQFKQVLSDRAGHPGAIHHMNRIYERKGSHPEKRDFGAVPIFEDSDQASTSFGLAPRAGAPRDSRAARSSHAQRPIIGKSIAMQRVLRLARLAAASDATVLITGANGTGKELIARVIHHNSSRRDRIFLPLNCAAIPESLIESELFGHERGAFTGAESKTIGRFEAADHGTIFLDEIAELDPNMQVKLLRVLQEREFTRVGGTETIHVDVRIIAATNRNLEELLARNLFRQDLFFRLNVLPIRIPLLSERVEDVPLLVDYFVQKYGKGSVKREALIGEDDMRVLMEHDWPGNIRELENLIERATILGTQVSPILQEIAHRRRLKVHAQRLGREPDNGRPAIRPEEAAASLPTATAVAEQAAGWEPMSIRNLEKRHILQMLGYTGGNRSQAAKLLGINPATLWRKMKLYEISGD